MRTRHSLILYDWAFLRLWIAPFASISFSGHTGLSRIWLSFWLLTSKSDEPRLLLPLVPTEAVILPPDGAAAQSCAP